MTISNPAVYRFGTFELSVAARRLTRSGVAVALTPKALDVLLCLVERPGQAVDRDALLKAVWPDTAVDERNLPQQIFAVRRALGDCAGYVVTLPGRGYQFIEPVFRVSEETPSSTPEVQAPAMLPERIAEVESSDGIAQAPRESVQSFPASAERRTRWAWWRAATAALAIGVLGWGVRKKAVPSAKAEPHFVSVVLADFHNTTGEPGLEVAVREAVEISLSQSPFLEVLGRGEVGTVLKAMGRDPQEALEPALAREVCERGNQQVLLTGTLTKLQEQYVLTLQASACTGGKVLAGSRAQVGSAENLLRVVDRSAAELRTELGESAASIKRADMKLEEATTPSLEALRVFSAGSAIDARGIDHVAAIRLYQRAVAIDPNFALAWQALSNLYYTMNEPARAAEAARRAFALSARVSERERFAIQMHYYADAEEDLPAAIATGQAWATAYPHDWRPLALMTGEFNDMGRFDDAIVTGRRALALNDRQSLIYSDLARAERRAGHWDAVRLLGAAATAHNVDSGGLHDTLYQNAFATEDEGALRSETAWAAAHPTWSNLCLLAETAAYHGQLREAARLFAIAHRRAIEDGDAQSADSTLLLEAETYEIFGMREKAQSVSAPIRALTSADLAEVAVLRLQWADRSTAEAFLRQARTRPHSTLLQYFGVPSVTGSLAMNDHQPARAAALLEPVAHLLEAGYLNTRLHGTFVLQAEGCEAALPDWDRILSNPGIDPLSPVRHIARLQRARCYAHKRRFRESRAEYERLLPSFHEADAEVPLVQQARAEAAALPQT